MPHHQPVLGLFAKWPQPGMVKTRLAAATTPAFAAEAAGAFLRDSLARLRAIDARRVLAFAPATARPQFAALAAGDWELTPQAEGDLGTRLRRFFQEQFDAGAGRVVAVGSDSPTLPLDYVQSALEQLATHDVAIGPAVDGGYYLIGLNRPRPELFEGIPWSGSGVLRQTVARLGGARLALLPPWYDIDTLDDWRLLHGHLTALRQAGSDPQAPHTEALAAREA